MSIGDYENDSDSGSENNSGSSAMYAVLEVSPHAAAETDDEVAMHAAAEVSDNANVPYILDPTPEIRQQLNARKVFRQQLNARMELQHATRHATRHQHTLVQHVQRAKVISKVLLEELPGLSQVSAEILEAACKEVITFQCELADFVMQVNASGMLIMEVARIFSALIKKIEKNFFNKNGIVAWNPATYRSDLDALRSSVHKLMEMKYKKSFDKDKEIWRTSESILAGRPLREQESLGSCDAKRLDRAMAYYSVIRRDQILFMEEQYQALDSISHYVERIADDLEGPLTNKFAEGAIPHLILRYFKVEAGLPISGCQSHAAHDFHILVSHIASQIRGRDNLDAAVTAIEQEFNLWELCNISDITEDESAKKRLMQKLGLRGLVRAQQQFQMASSALKVSRRERCEIEEQLGALAAGDADERAELKEALNEASGHFEEKRKEVEELKAEYQEELVECKEFDAAWTLMRKVTHAFEAVVHTEIFAKEVHEVRTRIHAFSDYFRGPVQTYTLTGEMMKHEFVKLVQRPSLENLEGTLEEISRDLAATASNGEPGEEQPKARVLTNSSVDRNAQPAAGINAALGSAFTTGGMANDGQDHGQDD